MIGECQKEAVFTTVFFIFVINFFGMMKRQKTCSRCKVEKPFDEFNFRNKLNNVRHAYCKECGKILTKSHYKRNKRQYLDRNSRSYKTRREYTRQLKNCPCADCGITYPYYVMDFDHREGEIKKYLLSQTERMSINSIKREIAKCDVICANCHRERTHQRRIKNLEK